MDRFSAAGAFILALATSRLPAGDITYESRDVCVSYVSLVNSSE